MSAFQSMHTKDYIKKVYVKPDVAFKNFLMTLQTTDYRNKASTLSYFGS